MRKLKLISLICSAAVTMSLLPAAGAAADDKLSVKADYETYVLTLYGTAGEAYEGEIVNIQIVKPLGEGINEIPEINSDNYEDLVPLQSYTVVEEDGSYHYSFRLSESAKKENPYWVKITVDSPDAKHPALHEYTSFSYTSKTEVDRKLSEFEETVNPQTFEDNCDLLDIKIPSVYNYFDETQKNSVAFMISEKIKASGKKLSTTDLQIYVTDSVFMVSVQKANSSAQLKTFLSDTQSMDYFGLDFENKYYVNLNANQNEVSERIFSHREQAVSKEDIGNLFREHLLLINVCHASNKNAVPGLIEEFKDVISASNYSNYNGLSSQTQRDSVNVAVVSASADKSENIEAFNAMLEKSIHDAKNSGGSTGGGGGSNGGSTSSGRNQIIIPTPESTPSSPDNLNDSPFKDLENYEWAKESINTLYSKNIINGKETGKFSPESLLTREEFVKIICCAFNFGESTGTGYFDDVDNTAWYVGYVNAAYEQGIISGIGDRKFGVSAPITREDVLVIMARSIKKMGYSVEVSKEVEFSDTADISDYALDAVLEMSGAGVINGYPDGRFIPENNITRAEAAVAVANLLKIYTGGSA
ncbi:MAG: S-layer homology domain-containing protein [Clostridia bacterium]|nr:S-layer homology domain-containing protein [Clostridia bacterium]